MEINFDIEHIENLENEYERLLKKRKDITQEIKKDDIFIEYIDKKKKMESSQMYLDLKKLKKEYNEIPNVVLRKELTKALKKVRKLIEKDD